VEITEVRVKLVTGKNDKLRAFCSITIDNDFVVRDLKVIDGVKGPFVAMPSRKVMERCPACGGKNNYRARFCNECGRGLSPRSASAGRQRGPEEGAESEERSKFHTEIAHPINSRCREVIQQRVLQKFQEEIEKSAAPDYRPDAVDEDFEFDDYFHEPEPASGPAATARIEDRAARAGRAGGDGEAIRGAGRPAFDSPELSPRWRGRGAEEPAPGGPGAGKRSAERFSGAELGDDGGDARGRPKRRSPAEYRSDLEPEDNFGAGIFP
jgi:stage V sporulation protein G